jgi:YegS/Rv2252/BmrU family lipid kinase
MKKDEEASFLKNWLVIINPNAGARRGQKDWPGISEILKKEGFGFTSILTTHRGHATDLSREQILKGYKKIIVVGGDGTLNEVVNGIFQQEKYASADITIGMVMVGTGNDWGRTFGIPTKYSKAVQLIKRGKTFIQDAGMVSYFDGEQHKRHFINMAGLGYDGLVAHKTNVMKEKGRGGTLAYLYNLLLGLFEYRQPTIEINIDGAKVFTGRVFSMSVGICKYNGGGMMQCPKAVPDDGILDITLIKFIHKYKALVHINKLYSGNFENLSFVRLLTGKNVTISRKQGTIMKLETDGESLGRAPYHFQVVPGSLKVIIGAVEPPL